MPTTDSLQEETSSSTTGQRWVAETRHGQTVGWLVLDKRTGQIVRTVRYVEARDA